MANITMRRRLMMLLRKLIETIHKVLLIVTRKTRLLSLKAFGGIAQDSIPTPVAPVDICTNNGLIRYGFNGVNLFNPEEINLNYYYNDSGTQTYNTSTYTSFRIPMEPNTTVRFSRESYVSNVYLRIHAFDENNQWIGMVAKSASANSLSVEGTTPPNTTYIRVCGAKNTSNEIDRGVVVEKCAIYAEGDIETIAVHGKNFLDNDACNRVVINTSNRNGWGITLPAGTYTVSCQSSAGFVTTFVNSEWGSSLRLDTDTTRTITINQSGVIYVHGGSGVSIAQVQSRNFQLEIGTSATEYEAYQDNGIALAEPLLKFDIDHQDEQELLTGTVTRRVGIKIIGGDEEWSSVTSDYAVTTKSDLGIDDAANDAILISTHSSNEPDNKITIDSDGNVIFYYDLASIGVTSVSTLKQWFADQLTNDTPVFIVYPLAAPVTEQADSQELSFSVGTNIINISQASLSDLEIEATVQ